MESTSPHGMLQPADPIESFKQITQEVLRIAEESCGIEDLEESFEQALAILQRNPDLQKDFEAEVISLLESLEEGTVELISYAMHELRWNAIEEEVKNRMTDPHGDISNIRLYEAILDSFSDSWRDKDLYSRFLQ